MGISVDLLIFGHSHVFLLYMPQPYFQFKQFTVWHDKCAMKVGTDGVLLGAWAPVGSAKRILDIGTGTGLVALMLAQRTEDASITALEIDKDAAIQAQENINRSPWKERIEVSREDFNHYHPSVKYDLIVSNPPYFVDSLESPDQKRNCARHNGSLTYEELLKGVTTLLSPQGTFALVIPSSVAGHVMELADKYALYPSAQLSVITKANGQPKRTLISFTFAKQQCHTEDLLTETARHQYSEEYIRLTKDFYLKM